ncbi:MAG TPA: HAMP domain-containing sensor histidine kinase [Nitrososphaeraceae archaeon]
MVRPSEHAMNQNVELQKKNIELAHLYSDLQKSFEALCEINKKLREANERLQKNNKAQTEFINIAAHELRTPTQSIIGYCEMLDLFPERTKQYLDRVARNADRLYTLTSDLLDATRIDIGILNLNNVDFNLTDTIRQVADDIRKKPYLINKNAHVDKIKPNIQLTLPSHPIVVHADKDRIAQVLSNLLDNAVRFTNSGTITVSAKPCSSNLVKVSVKDSGKGIDPEIHPKLFHKFATKSDRGVGLGLFISKSIVEAHGGSIFGKNNKDGSGATFSFTLPAVTTTREK